MPFADLSRPAPVGLVAEGFSLRPIRSSDAARDYAAVMESREDLRLWEQSAWPEDDFTLQANRADVVEMEQRHAARRAFSYTVTDPADTRCLGCVYLFEPGASFLAASTVTPLADACWAEVDAVVYFWVRSSCVQSGLEGRLLAALRLWCAGGWGFTSSVFVVSEPFTRQLELVRRTDLVPEFEVREPDKPARFLAFG
ncbi:N-acetyltransferase [Glutamicibacter sp. MNS18]|uniref:N-acetyltransferase n=1 Tax=Glutamicibacter sp. MNS18 TaxID=2989817 RepID=UPI002236AF7C|nr:N-acetyltransferase [Glutamicibacter sp. MNS18]MCW4464288.1 N-acetyltransferase [Glutamicibacter sp. MNS18]